MDRQDQDQRPSFGSYLSVGLLLAGVAFGALVEQPGFVPMQSRSAPIRPTRLTITVPDLNAAVRWYEDKLGFVRLAVLPQADGTPLQALLVRDTNLIELVAGQEGSRPGPVRMAAAEMPDAIAVDRVPILLDDIDGEISALAEQGVEVVSGPRDAKRRPLRVGIVRDLNGLSIELQEPL